MLKGEPLVRVTLQALCKVLDISRFRRIVHRDVKTDNFLVGACAISAVWQLA